MGRVSVGIAESDERQGSRKKGVRMVVLPPFPGPSVPLVILLLHFFFPQQPQDPPAQKGPALTTKVRRTMSSRVHEAVKAIALCHNVTPVYESNGVTDQAEAEKQYEDSCRVYQASSPDEVSLGYTGASLPVLRLILGGTWQGSRSQDEAGLPGKHAFKCLRGLIFLWRM